MQNLYRDHIIKFCIKFQKDYAIKSIEFYNSVLNFHTVLHILQNDNHKNTFYIDQGAGKRPGAVVQPRGTARHIAPYSQKPSWRSYRELQNEKPKCNFF